MDYNCKDFKVGKCEGEKLVDGETMPLVLQPPEPNQKNLESLLVAIKNNKEWFEKMLIKNSSVLLRGYDVENAVEFNEIVEAFGWEEIPYVGPAPRTHIHGRVQTANEGPLSEFIYFHHEMVLMKQYPGKVMFYCEVPPPEGGETALAPSFRVAQRMLQEFPQLVEEMDSKGLKYTLTTLSKNNNASIRGRGWEVAFGTSDRAEAERRAKGEGLDIEWLENGGANTIFCPRSATKVFEGRKGRRMWFNTIVGMHGKELSSATMADGSEIPENMVKRCGEIIEEESFQFKWEKGDVLFLDNLAMLHARRPSLPPRKVLVAICN